MNKEVKSIIDLILAAVGLAIGVAVIVFSIIDSDVSINNQIRMLGIAVFALGLFAINNIPKDKN